MSEQQEQKVISVKDVMTVSPVKIDGLASVDEALRLMRSEGHNALVIDKRFEGDEYGMITVHQIAEKVIGANRSTKRTSVYEIMVKPVLTVRSNMDIKYAIRLLTQFDLSRALVTEQDHMVGLVTLRDMAVRYVDHME